MGLAQNAQLLSLPRQQYFIDSYQTIPDPLNACTATQLDRGGPLQEGTSGVWKCTQVDIQKQGLHQVQGLCSTPLVMTSLLL